jgi:hypothetical protein
MFWHFGIFRECFVRLKNFEMTLIYQNFFQRRPTTLNFNLSLARECSTTELWED